MNYCRRHPEVLLDEHMSCPVCDDNNYERLIAEESLEYSRRIAENAEKQVACYRCGQRYDSDTTKRPSRNEKWIGSVSDLGAKGICPRCYHTAVEKGEVKEKTRSEMETYYSNLISRLRNSSEADELKRLVESEGYRDLSQEVTVAAEEMRKSERELRLKQFADLAAKATKSSELDGLLRKHGDEAKKFWGPVWEQVEKKRKTLQENEHAKAVKEEAWRIEKKREAEIAEALLKAETARCARAARNARRVGAFFRWAVGAAIAGFVIGFIIGFFRSCVGCVGIRGVHPGPIDSLSMVLGGAAVTGGIGAAIAAVIGGIIGVFQQE